MSNQPSQPAHLVRRRWHIRGQVQGVGFRPFVWRLAREHRVTGVIRNDSAGVILEAQAGEETLAHFIRDLQAHLPPLARIDNIREETIPPGPQETDFTIQHSAAGNEPEAAVTVDTALCDDCRREMFDPSDRRSGYGLINCTNCGPRFSIIQRVPYDRINTTMAGFVMCPACAAEYTSPESRRFHAQPISCPDCGPQVELIESSPLPSGGAGRGLLQVGNRTPTLPAPVKGEGVYRAAAQLLWQGKILALKGLGGFHLAVRADDAEAVARLRALKHRDAKPFALMCRTLDDARQLVHLDEPAAALLTSREAPIVLARRSLKLAPTVREGCKPARNITGNSSDSEGSGKSVAYLDPVLTRGARNAVAEAVAPGNHRLGVMLPYTPIQHLLFAELTRLTGPQPCPALVMTSGNLSDEPLAIDNQEVVRRLGGLCDAILWHDRPIERALDDSVYLANPGEDPLPIRRSRGFVPTEIPLPGRTGSPAGSRPPETAALHSSGLCVGGELKNTVAVVRNGSAILSQHLGDLTHPLAYEYFQKAIEDLIALFGIAVRWIAHDLHPQYLSTVHARELARRWQVPLIGVAHHHAHAASVMAEYGETGPVLAVACDGTGYGPDGTIWGGELLRADLVRYQRLARLRPLSLAGGDAAAKDTRRSALALLQLAYGDDFPRLAVTQQLVPDQEERALLCTMLRRNFNCTRSSGAGRYFDGVSGLLGLCAYNQFEAQAAIQLEAAAAARPDLTHALDQPLFKIRPDETHQDLKQIDLAPLIRRLVEGMERNERVAELSALFHDQLAGAWEATAIEASEATGIRTVVFSGGVFCNQRFTQRLQNGLERRGLRVLRHRLVPCNDGGLALGQAAIAVARMTEANRK